MWIRVVRVSDGLVGTGAQAIPIRSRARVLVIRDEPVLPFVAMGSEGTLTVSQRLASAMVGATITSLVVTPLDVVKTRMQAVARQVAVEASNGERVALTRLARTLPGPNAELAACPSCGVLLVDTGLMEHALSKSACQALARHAGPDVRLCGQRVVVIVVAIVARRGGRRDRAGRARLARDRRGDRVARREPRATWRALRAIGRAEGGAALFVGIVPTLVMSVPNTALYFCAYDDGAARLHGAAFAAAAWPRRGVAAACGARDAIALPMLAGGAARAFAATIVAPFELVRTQLMAAGGAGARVARELAAGVRGAGAVPTLWRGLAPTLWRDIPFLDGVLAAARGREARDCTRAARARRARRDGGARVRRGRGRGRGRRARRRRRLTSSRRAGRCSLHGGRRRVRSRRVAAPRRRRRGGGAASTWATLREVVASEGPAACLSARPLRLKVARCAAAIASHEGGAVLRPRRGRVGAAFGDPMLDSEPGRLPLRVAVEWPLSRALLSRRALSYVSVFFRCGPAPPWPC